MNTFFDNDGILNLDETVMEKDSFRKIMEDGIVTDDEVMEQASKVTTLLHKAQESLSDEQTKLVKDLLSEMSVLFAVYHYKELQTLK